MITPTILLLGINLEKTKPLIQKDTCAPNVHSSIIYSSQDMEATQVSTNRWMDKEDVVYIYNEILLSRKKRMK